MHTDPLLPGAVFFDFDGVLVDTEPLHYAAFTEALAPEGLAFSREEYDAFYMGFDDRDAVDAAARAKGKQLESEVRCRMLNAKVESFTRLARDAHLAPLPGVVPLIRALQKNGVPLALCSGALRQDIDPILDRIGLAIDFSVRVTADDVPHSKPDPASYQLAHKRLCRHRGTQIPPEQCIAIEDTPAGVESARGAGLRVLAVSAAGPNPLLARADRIVSTLEMVTLDDLSRVLARDSAVRSALETDGL